ncbi:hypothetical protein V1504DRAFT_108045 [Lipomyces starkeyi]
MIYISFTKQETKKSRSTMAPKGPYKLCTVNTAPERAKRLAGRVVEDVKEEYTILYVENAETEVLNFMERPSWISRNDVGYNVWRRLTTWHFLTVPMWFEGGNS